MKLTEEQKKILQHDPTKHACILAGPGTGKSSTVISYATKIKKKYPDKKIRLLTFTRAANSELIDKIIKEGEESVVSSTVHSFAISVLISNPGSSGLPEPIRIADNWEWDRLIKKGLARKLDTTVSNVDKLKNEMSSSWESLVEAENASVLLELRAKFMGLWEEHRRVFAYSLLSELPFRLKTALEGNPNLDLANIELIAVDEYQDLNACDLQCFRLIAQRGITIIGIGDDDQSIYGFRKAHPAGIRDFFKEYNSVRYSLSVSHRCGKKILDWANYIICGDTTRPKKPVLSPWLNNPAGEVGFLVFNREKNEAEGIVKLIFWLTNNKKVPNEDILVLSRTKSVAKLLKNIFKKNGIFYSDPEESLELLKKDKTRILLAYLKLLANKTDSLAWWTLLELTKGIGQKTIDEIYNFARSKNATFGEIIVNESKCDFSNISTNKSKVQNLVNKTLKRIEDIDVPEKTKWGSWITDHVEKSILPKPQGELHELLEKIDEAKVGSELDLSQFISQIEPTLKDIMNSKKEGKIRIMSLNRSKGLTVKAVIIAGVEDGIIPHPFGDYQEERRLLYVGMTRAEEYLFLTRCRRRIGPTARSGKINVAGTRRPSPFLDGGLVMQTDGTKTLDHLGI